MNLELNKSYKTDNGYIIPRSHFNEDAMPNYAIFEVCEQIGNRYVVSHKTLTKKDVKEILQISAKEKLKLI